MSDDPSSSHSAANHGRSHERSWLDRLLQSFSNSEPKSQEELLKIIKEAAKNRVVDPEALEIIEGALGVSHLQVREIMVPRSQMVVINHEEKPREFLPKVIQSGHSRFPVIGESMDEVKGILLAKDLLPLILEPRENFNLCEILRPANIIPESKRLNVLLKEFREKRYHMALVIDEYGGVSGLVTIEDVLEQIVGDIGDEYDVDDEIDIRKEGERQFTVRAQTAIEDFNEYFETEFSDEEFDTIGGLAINLLGRLPRRGETFSLGGFEFKVLRADRRRLDTLRVITPTDIEPKEEN